MALSVRARTVPEMKLVREVRGALNSMGHEIENRAAEIESRIMHALQRKRFLKSVNGRRQVAPLDIEELAGEMEILAGIERRLNSFRAQILQTKPAPDGELSGEPEIQPARSSIPSTARARNLEQLVRKAARIGERVDFVDDLNTRGCAVCNRMDGAAAHFFASWQYALSARNQPSCACGFSWLLFSSHVAIGGDGISARGLHRVFDPYGAAVG